ncbi:hypothetical protein HK105_200208 [Polyrhizophydium stewartii]|uniref:AB hydrolase-1 domain-containing protein n=1 Tax=Polyrhizophydium stewartii TaxID=2732419 RepID=A0ABR4NKU8_9FUNG|nr:hypothetical protein HK105_002139 [Polyrhizophydium stewartii]
MPMNPLDPASFTHKHARVRGRLYHFVEEGAGDKFAVLCHGFPDLWFGWRYQVPALVAQGFHVLVPSMLGYSTSEAPVVPDSVDVEGGRGAASQRGPSAMAAFEQLQQYGFRSVSEDLGALLDHVSGRAGTRATFLGHDWGGMLVWRVALHMPERVERLVAVCTPFTPPHREFTPIREVVKKVPSMAYQVLMQAPGAAAVLNAHLDEFAAGVFHSAETVAALARADGRPDPRLAAGSKHAHPLLKFFDGSGTALRRPMTPAEMAYYLAEFRRTGFAGAINWYRIRRVNYDDELGVIRRVPTHIPCLFIAAEHDPFLPPSMARDIKHTVPQVEIHTVDATHWALFEAPDEVNRIITSWLAKTDGAVKARL